MKALLFLVGLILVVAGGATGYVSQIDYGKALIGLNLGLAATLLVGGFVVIGLASVIGAISRLADDLPQALPSSGDHRMDKTTSHTNAPAKLVAAKNDDDDMPFPAATAAVGAATGAAGLTIASAFDDTDKGVDAAVDKVAEAAREAKANATETVVSATDNVAKVADNTSESFGDLVNKAKAKAQDAAEKTTDVAGDAKDAVTQTADDVAGAVEKTATDVADKTSDTADDLTSQAKTAEDNAPEKLDDGAEKQDSDVSNDAVDIDAIDIEAANDGDDGDDTAEVIGEHGDQLYIVEEVEIRGKPARVLSDNTVEAETAEGWMRFENIEHLEEYLDAMET